jgi:C1A family cysteine protease
VTSSDRNLRGWLPDIPDHRDRPFRLTSPVTPPPAAEVDALLHTAPDQGSIGSCVANAITSGLEWANKKEGAGDIDLSRLWLYLQARLIGGFSAAIDSGCYIRDGMKAAAQLGCCLEETWPYVPANFSVMPPSGAATEAADHQALWYYRCDTLEALKACIGVDGCPVVIGFSVPETIYSPESTRTGVVAFPGPTTKIIGGHAVIVVAYNDNTRLVKFQNSWGADWGDGGYGYLPYAFFEGGLCDDFWTIRTIEIAAPGPAPIPPPSPVPPPPKPRPRPIYHPPPRPRPRPRPPRPRPRQRRF